MIFRRHTLCVLHRISSSWVCIFKAPNASILHIKRLIMLSQRFNDTISSDIDFLIVVFHTVCCWHLDWNLYLPSHLAGQSENFFSLASRCLPTPSRFWETKKPESLQGNQEVQMTYSFWAQSFVRLKMEPCVSAQSPEESTEEKLVPAGRIKTKVQDLLCLFSGLQSAAKVPGLGNCCSLFIITSKTSKERPGFKESSWEQVSADGVAEAGKGRKVCTPILRKTDLKHFGESQRKL